MTDQPRDLRAELASVLGAMREFLTSGYDAVERELVEQWNSRLAALTEHGGGGEAVYQIQDGPEDWFDVSKAYYDRHLGDNKRILYTATTPQPRGDGMVVVDDALVRKVLDFKPSWSGVTLREYLEEGGVKYWSPSSYVWNDTHSKPYRMVQEVLCKVLAAAPGEGSGECPCGESTCKEPWEPGCGLGKSEGHVASQSEYDKVMDDALRTGTGFMVGGKRVPPSEVQVASQSAPSDGPANTRPVSEVVERWKQDPERKAGLDAARERLGPRPSDGGGPEPGEPAPPPSTPAQHYLASVNGVATQEWQDGFNEASRLASAPASQSLTDKVSALLAEHSLSEVVVALQRANDSVVLSYLGGKELG